MIDKEFIHLEKRQVHLKRYLIVADKIKQFADEIKEKNFIETPDHIRYGQLMEEAHEALLENYKDLLEDLKVFEEKVK